jgi:hypothetical protein
MVKEGGSRVNWEIRVFIGDRYFASLANVFPFFIPALSRTASRLVEPPHMFSLALVGFSYRIVTFS